jgi:hypothetical protein
MRGRGRSRSIVRVRRLLPAAVLAAVGLLAGAEPAMAGDALAPGGSQTLTVRLPGSWVVQAHLLDVSVAGLTQFENGCIEPEEEAGDDSCGVEQGDLAHHLVATVAAGRADGDGCLATVSAVPLQLVGRAVSSRLTVEGVQCLILRLEFPEGASDNVAQSDGLAFDLRVVAEGLGNVSTAPQMSGGADSAGGRAAAAVAAGNGGTRTGGVAGGAPGDGPGAAPPAIPGTTDTVVGDMKTAVTIGDTGAAGPAVQTAAGDTWVGGLVVAWGSVLLGAVALGWAAFALLVRRRRRKWAA